MESRLHPDAGSRSIRDPEQAPRLAASPRPEEEEKRDKKDKKQEKPDSELLSRCVAPVKTLLQRPSDA